MYQGTVCKSTVPQIRDIISRKIGKNYYVGNKNRKINGERKDFPGGETKMNTHVTKREQTRWRAGWGNETRYKSRGEYGRAEHVTRPGRESKGAERGQKQTGGGEREAAAFQIPPRPNTVPGRRQNSFKVGAGRPSQPSQGLERVCAHVVALLRCRVSWGNKPPGG